MKCLVATPHRYGIVEMARRVGRDWMEMGHTVDYLTAEGEAARVAGVTVGVPGIAAWWYKHLRRLAQEPTQYDLIWTHQPIAPMLPSRDPEFWRRIIVTFHTTERAEYRLARQGVYPRTRLPYLWFTKQLESRFYGQLTELPVQPQYTVVAPHLRDEVAGFGVRDAVHVPNGVFTPEGDYEPIRDEYGVPDDATLVFNVGSHTPQKRPVEFARIYREVTDRNPEVYCVMAGDGPLHSEVQKHTNDHVIAPGYVSDREKWRWFNDADVYSSLSAYEGMPVAAMEALSFDLPLLLSDIPAHRSLVQEYGVNGRLVEPDSVRVVDAAQELAGQRSNASLPSWTETAQQYLDVVSEETPSAQGAID